MALNSSDGTSFTKEKPNLSEELGFVELQEPFQKQIFYDPEIGYADIVIYEDFPDRIFLNAGYYLDLSKSDNFKKTIEVANDIFAALKEKGIKVLYCTANCQKAFNFNERLGFETNFEVIANKYEIMKKDLEDDHV